ncbi:MAG: hydantoinase/oxoprolinase family protein [Actinomycetota bacterium]|nr:hydantoinase/oxoprolinase family protein [Actinomycetota bacterium]
MTTDPKIYIGVDIGGTFTDAVAYDEASDVWRVAKVATSRESPEDGVLAAINQVVDPNDRHRTRLVAHATTLGINAIIERRGAATGLLVTEGFTDLLFMGSGQRYDVYELFPSYPQPLVPPDRVRPLAERLAPSGEVLLPLRRDEVCRAVDALVESGVESIAVCLLHAYANPEHELAVEELVKKRVPEIPVSISSSVSPEIREYPRLCTTVVNAYIRPLVGRYLSKLSERIAADGHRGQLITMLSDAGMVAPEAAAQHPVRILESGPAAGSILAEATSRGLRISDLLLFDMGGTTAKISTVLAGATRRTAEFEVARVHRFKAGSGIPLRTPVVDLMEIGAGGGSIARLDERGLIAVGPESSGADPGPACYARGGTHATVTDADLVLGYLSADRFLGGKMPLDLEAARSALARLGEPLELDAEGTARFVHSTVNASMAGAARVYLAERGIDAANLSMMAIGGAGPVHAEDVGREVGVERIVVPVDPGTGSAVGLVVAPLAFEVSRSAPSPVGLLSWEEVESILQDLRTLAREQLVRAGAAEMDVTEVVSVDMHLEGQSHEVAVILSDLDHGDPAEVLREAFMGSYLATFGRVPLERPLHLKTWRLRASAPAPGPAMRIAAPPPGSAGASPAAHRSVYFTTAGDFVLTPIFRRDRLRPGDELEGPAVVEEEMSATVAGPACRVRVLEDHSLLLELT